MGGVGVDVGEEETPTPAPHPPTYIVHYTEDLDISRFDIFHSNENTIFHKVLNRHLHLTLLRSFFFFLIFYYLNNSV